jgi:hypothetical protein
MKTVLYPDSTYTMDDDPIRDPSYDYRRKMAAEAAGQCSHFVVIEETSELTLNDT